MRRPTFWADVVEMFGAASTLRYTFKSLNVAPHTAHTAHALLPGVCSLSLSQHSHTHTQAQHTLLPGVCSLNLSLAQHPRHRYRLSCTVYSRSPSPLQPSTRNALNRARVLTPRVQTALVQTLSALDHGSHMLTQTRSCPPPHPHPFFRSLSFGLGLGAYSSARLKYPRTHFSGRLDFYSIRLREGNGFLRGVLGLQVVDGSEDGDDGDDRGDRDHDNHNRSATALARRWR